LEFLTAADRVDMVKQDARKLSREALGQQRAEVVRLHQECVRVMEIVKRTGLCWSTVNGAIRLWKKGGDQALQPAARGRKAGSGAKLTPDQEAAIRQLIRQRSPRHYGLKDALWSRDAVLRLVEKNLGITLTPRGMGNYLNRWGVVGGDPRKTPRQRCTLEVRGWLNANYPILRQRARAEDAAIYWVNKPVTRDAVLWSWARPIIEDNDDLIVAVDPAEELENVVSVPRKISVASVENAQGKLLWAIGVGAFGAQRQVRFLRALIKDARGKTIFLITSDMRDYRSEAFLHLLGSHREKLKVFPDHDSIQASNSVTPGV